MWFCSHTGYGCDEVATRGKQQAPPFAPPIRGRVYVPRVLDRDSNMHFLRLYGFEELVQVPPFGIREPPLVDAAGTPRADILQGHNPLQLVSLNRGCLQLASVEVGIPCPLP